MHRLYLPTSPGYLHVGNSGFVVEFLLCLAFGLLLKVSDFEAIGTINTVPFGTGQEVKSVWRCPMLRYCLVASIFLHEMIWYGMAWHEAYDVPL